MKKFLAVVWLTVLSLLDCVALGQVVLSGSAVLSGSGQGYATGAPLTYGARSDNCVFGTESGCGSTPDANALTFQMRTTDSVPFAAYPNAPMNATAMDPDFHSYMVMGTDWTVKKATSVWTVNTGIPPFNVNTTMLWLGNSSGAYQLFLLSPTAVRAAEAAHSTTCTGCVIEVPIVTGTIQPSCGTSCTNVDSTGVASWSTNPSEPNILYELLGDNVTLNKLTIQPDCNSTTCTFSRTPVVQMTSNSPVSCSVLPSNYVTGGWNGNMITAADGSITWATGGAGEWAASTAYYALANDSNTTPTSFIFPQTNNGSSPKNAFEAVTTGYSYSVEPVWSGTSSGSPYLCEGASQSPTSSPISCPTTCGSGAQACAQWFNIGSVKGQGNGFDFLDYRPGVGCSRLNTFVGKVYRGVGEPEPSGSWTTDDNTICPEYGVTYPGTCPFPDTGLQIHDGTTKTPAYAAFTPTGGGGACPVAGTCSCAETGDNYLAGWSASANYKASTNDTIYDPTNVPHSLYKAITNSGPLYGGAQPPVPGGNSYWARTDQSCYTHIWQRNSTIVRPTMCRGAAVGGNCQGHATDGQVYLFKGTYQAAHYWSRPSDSSSVPWANPGFNTLPNLMSTGTPGDTHSSYWNSSGADQTPWMLSNTSVPTATYAIAESLNGGGANESLWYGECVMFGFNSSGPTVFYRMFHSFNTGSDAGYGPQNNFCQISFDGQWAAVVTDMMGTRGSTSPDFVVGAAHSLGDTIWPCQPGGTVCTTPTNLNPGGYDFQILSGCGSGCTLGTLPASFCQTTGCTVTDGSGNILTNLGAPCNQLRAFYSPTNPPSAGIASGNGPASSVFPVNQNGFNIYTVTSGTTSGTPPNTAAWNAAGNYGQTLTWGGATLTNEGPNDCRADVILVDLLSAN